MVTQARQVSKAIVVIQVQRAPLVTMVNRVVRVSKEIKAQMEILVSKEKKVHLALLV